MNNGTQDFVTDVKPKLTIDFDGRKTRTAPQKIRERHNILRQLRTLITGSDGSTTTEEKLAQKCNADMRGQDWLDSVESLYSRGYIVPIRAVWDGKNAEWRKLKDDEKTVTLLANGLHFASMSFEQAMQLANERISPIG